MALYTTVCLAFAVGMGPWRGADAAPPIPTTFGQAMHHHHLDANVTGEYELFTRSYQTPTPSQMTYFWMTCGGADGSKCFNLYKAVFRYYVDGETTPSVELPYGLAHGVGGTWEGPQQNESVGPRCLRGDCSAPWSAGATFGHSATTGALFDTFRVPFSTSLRITIMAPPAGDCDTCRNADASWSLYVIVRGIESPQQGVRVGDITLPHNARLRSVRHTATYPAMSFVPLFESPAGTAGVILLTSLSVASGTENFLEGCVRAYIDGSSDTTLLSSGTEDYFQSAFYFDAGQFAFAEAGLTHLNNSQVKDDPRAWTLSAYKLHQQDALAFRNGINVTWRNGDTASSLTHLKCCGDPTDPMPTGCYALWDPRPSDIDVLVLAYTYPVTSVYVCETPGFTGHMHAEIPM